MKEEINIIKFWYHHLVMFDQSVSIFIFSVSTTCSSKGHLYDVIKVLFTLTVNVDNEHYYNNYKV